MPSSSRQCSSCAADWCEPWPVGPSSACKLAKRMRESRWQQFDFVIVACVLGLVLSGVAMIHSATCPSPCMGLLPPSSYALRQGVSAAAGFALLVGMSLIDYRIYRVYAYHLYGFAVALLVLVLAIGQGGADADYGSRRWIHLGLFELQASEVAKLEVLI